MIEVKLNSRPKIGDRVQVLADVYNEVLPGFFGEVESIPNDYQYSVRVDGLSNHASSYGTFLFTAKELEVVRREYEIKAKTYDKVKTLSIAQNKANLVPLTGYAFLVKVAPIDRLYKVPELFACYDPVIAEGDMCVTIHYATGTLEIGVIEEVVDTSMYTCYVYNEVVCRLHTKEYLNRYLKRDLQRKLLDEMSDLYLDLECIETFKLLAEVNSEMKELVDKYKETENAN